MNKLFKKLVSGLITASMLLAAVPAIVSADELPTDDLLVNITFDEDGTGSGSFAATAGGTVTEKGSVSYADSWDGKSKALSISTNAAGNYLELPKGILNGKPAATFSFWIKPSSGWAFMTTPLSGAQDYLNEKYIGMLANNAYTVERYNNSGTRLSSVGTGANGDWQYVTAVCEANGTKLYINGELKASDEAAVDIASLFTSGASTWIGHGNWGNGEGFSGMIDDFRIYGRVLSEDEVAALGADGAAYERKQLVAKNRCYIADAHFYNGNDEVFSSTDLTGDLTIKTTVSNYTSSDGDATVEAYINDAAIASDSKTISLISGTSTEVELTVSGVKADDNVTVKVTTPKNGETETNTIATLYGGVQAPQAAPPDSGTTTDGAHDPSIVKFPDDDTYYVYSSHHLIFTSKDLINWKKYDFTNIDAKVISPKTYSFISSNYSNTTMNGTYWAPDVIYREGDDHPYWMYISVSCGLGGRNSAISLMKSDSPLFWADKDANIIDTGVVFATKENSNYKTNAIDANIYTDSNDGKQYFVWGSFWGGIQAAPLTDEGLVQGIDYTSDATILSSCQNFGTSVFTQKDGVAGPEGAWMIEHGDYRYMFTSYGWLGSNYNTRMARAPLSTPFSTNMGTQLVDANGVVMGTQQSKGSRSTTTGYKLIGSYRLGDGPMDLAVVPVADNKSDNYAVNSQPGDAMVYYGPGHNSAINTDNGSFYVSHTRKGAVEIAATLQIRKMLWTEDGWPVVSPVTYAGEVEQAIPEEMLVGTYDLASVGRTKMNGSQINNSGRLINRNYDLPVLSSKVTLNEDGTLADGLGTWTFDGDHKITLTFAKDGDTSLDEFYKAGDVMTMYALFGYDKDEAKPVIALTGIDKNHVTQFAKKSLLSEFRTEPEANAIVLEKSAGGNPILGFGANGETMYAGDPAAFVDGDTVYIIAGHDTSTNDKDYVMPNWVAYSSKDMKEWKYEGIVMDESSISWVNDKVSAWASQAIKYNGKYYLYYCAETKHSIYGGKSIGVAVADAPTGPYVDIGEPLVVGSFTPDSSTWNDIDPTVWVETVDGEEHRYLSWGNNKLFICELNENMISIKDLNGDGNITMGDDVIEQTVEGGPGIFTEAPWIYRQQDESGNYYGSYYLFYAMGWREQMAYATIDNLLDKTWKYQGTLMPPTATSNTNHPSVIDFKGKTYFIYHNGSLPWGCGYRRSVCVEEFTINEDGTIDPIQETSIGLTGTASAITQGDDYIVHENFVNPGGDNSYPLSVSVSVGRAIADELDIQWEILPGKADTSNETYVSIQSVNKPGLYLAAQSDGSVVLTQDSKQNDTVMKQNMTFRTIEGLNGEEDSVSFESVSNPGKYLANVDGALMIATPVDEDACTFNVDKAEDKPVEGKLATITDAWANDDSGVNFYLNNAMLYGNVTVYVAEYNSSNELIGVKISRDEPVISMRQSFRIDYTRKEADSKLKVFVWSDLMPIAEHVKVTASENPYKMPDGYTSYFAFEDNLKDEVSSVTGTVAATNIDGSTTAEASYADGFNGKAVSFTGAGGTGINLGKVITNTKYTVAFRIKANAFTQYTSGVFVNSGTKASEDWMSAPFGSMMDGNTMIWSKRGSASHVSLDSSGTMMTGTWHHVAVAADGNNASLYIDGVKTGSGTVANVVTSDTNTYLGVNFWDTPFNGLIDELYIYNGKTLTDTEVTNLYEATK
ncbi:MAG: family 43 glycosylhydrolase [Oscillospiraceae bacterium]|nr:family 43 glycosylhydrolase [Oscillospiraceae bacterium]